MNFELHLGDCVDVMAQWPSDSVDALCTDPPYGLRFMSKAWDFIGADAWEQIAWNYRWAVQALRVMKPGAFGCVFNHSRTVHYLMLGLEAAGFEIRDTIDWFYFNGFPKSENDGGTGTALKPAKEPIVLIQKPRVGTYRQNVVEYGTGMLNIDACRTVAEGEVVTTHSRGSNGAFPKRPTERSVEESGRVKDQRIGLDVTTERTGRWPANVIIDELVAYEMDLRCGQVGAKAPVTGNEPSVASKGLVTNKRARVKGAFHGDKGGPSRFFYCPKPTRAEREYGCEGLPIQTAGEMTDREDGSDGLKSPRAGAGRTAGARNFHPTLKPINLMRYLCRLVTPRGGVVLDPFMGSGTTGIAALREGFDFVGVEQELKYMGIAVARVGTASHEREDDEEDQVGSREGSGRGGDRGARNGSSAGGQAAPPAPAPVQQTGR